MIFDETLSLHNGKKIPKLGLGTWFIKDGEAAEAVRSAVKNRVPPYRYRPDVQK